MSEFVALMTVYLRKVKNIEKFRELIEDTYLNKQILERVRNKMSKQIIKKHRTDFQQVKSKNCDDFEAYCKSNVTFIPKLDQQQPAFNLKGDEVLSNLKFNFYRPFFELKIKKKVTKLSLPMETIKRINTLIEQNNSDTSVIESDTVQEVGEVHSLTLSNKKRKQSFGNIFKMINNDEDIGLYKLDFKERKKGEVFSYIKKNKDLEEGNTDPNESFFRYKIDRLLFKPNDVLCVRNKHTCYLKKIEREREILRKERKRKFFKKSNKKLFAYLAEIIKNFILFKEHGSVVTKRHLLKSHKGAFFLILSCIKPFWRTGTKRGLAE